MILASDAVDAAADTAAQTPWWQGALGPAAIIVAAGIAAWVATRNNRKSPHENLKMLIDIRGEIMTVDAQRLVPLDLNGAIEMSIRHEIANLEKLNAARSRGRLAVARERIRQFDLLDTVAAGFLGVGAVTALAGVLLSLSGALVG
ncbi:hypothetical protein LCL87_03530 [Rhodococcus hoagii]|nr:hypothetical protein [Prescottella equi]